jgi:hypothetical protein
MLLPVYAGNLAAQAAGSVLALEHALTMLLLLTGLLAIQGKLRRYVPWVVLAGVALSLFTPIYTIEFTWPIVSALVLPILLWRVAMRLATVHVAFTWRGWLAWLSTALLIGLAVAVEGGAPLASALLLGILAASLMWQVRERAVGSTDLGAFGQLALALLLAEVDVTLHPAGRFFGSPFVGGTLGALLGYIGVRVALRLPAGNARSLFYVAAAYLAYLAGVAIGGSSVVTVVMTGLMVAVYGYRVGLWPTSAELPAPFNWPGVFALLAGAFLLLAWQAHVPLTATRAAGVGLGTIAAAAGVLIGRRLDPLPDEAAPSLLRGLLHKERNVFLLLLGTLLLWPAQATLEPWPLVIALLAALIAVLILRILLYPIFGLMGIELRAPGASVAQDEGKPREEA